jgi:uncharacterized protein (DUF58 family)
MEGARSTALLGLALLIGAALFDAEGLYVAGIAFVLLAIVSVVWVLTGIRGLRIERRLGARRVVEDEPLLVELTVSSARIALPSCAIDDALLPAPARVRGGRRTATVRISARFGRRGRRVLVPPAVVVRDPLGLGARAVTGAQAHEILVLPRVEPLVGPGAGEGEAGSIARRLQPGIVQAAEVDIDGLRPHREGAPASRIHWPAVARTGELIERRLRPEGDARALVVLDTRAGSGEGAGEALDAAVRAAASLSVHLAKAGGCALLLPGDRRPSPLESSLAGWPHLHARLAVVDEGGAPPLGALGARRGPIVYVASRPLTRPPAGLLNAPASGRFLVVPGVIEGRTPAFTVAGCTAYDLAPARRRRAAA